MQMHSSELKKLLVHDDLIMDPKTSQVTRSGKKIKLTPNESKLLKYLLENSGRIISRSTILKSVWHYSSGIETRVVDVYVGYLRKKIDKNSPKKIIHSIRGKGYGIK